ncbi:unnamed protein product, partial [Protopolystoma xenopodis]
MSLYFLVRLADGRGGGQVRLRHTYHDARRIKEPLDAASVVYEPNTYENGPLSGIFNAGGAGPSS